MAYMIPRFVKLRSKNPASNPTSNPASKPCKQENCGHFLWVGKAGGLAFH